VVLPAPEGPTRATLSPGAISRQMSSRALVCGGRIAEGDVFEADRRPRRLHRRFRPGGFVDGRFRVQQFEQPLGRPGGAHHIAPHFRHGADAAGHQGRVKDEGGELASGQGAVGHLAGADPEHEDDRSHDGGDDQGRQRRAHSRAFDRSGETHFRALGEAPGFLPFLV